MPAGTPVGRHEQVGGVVLGGPSDVRVDEVHGVYVSRRRDGRRGGAGLRRGGTRRQGGRRWSGEVEDVQAANVRVRTTIAMLRRLTGAISGTAARPMSASVGSRPELVPVPDPVANCR